MSAAKRSSLKFVAPAFSGGVKLRASVVLPFALDGKEPTPSKRTGCQSRSIHDKRGSRSRVSGAGQGGFLGDGERIRGGDSRMWRKRRRGGLRRVGSKLPEPNGPVVLYLSCCRWESLEIRRSLAQKLSALKRGGRGRANGIRLIMGTEQCSGSRTRTAALLPLRSGARFWSRCVPGSVRFLIAKLPTRAPAARLGPGVRPAPWCERFVVCCFQPRSPVGHDTSSSHVTEGIFWDRWLNGKMRNCSN